jgi:RND family efflux transporter MFP subunit
MIRFILVFILIFNISDAIEIPIKEVKEEIFFDTLKTNSKIIQLTDAKQSIMSRVEGKITKYFVRIGDRVKEGQKVAKIESIELSKLYSELSLLKKQLIPIEKNYIMTKKLYKTGMSSLQEYNRQKIKYSEIKSKIDSIKSNLSLMGAKDKKSNSYILLAYNDGVVTDILKPLNAIVNRGEELINIANEDSIYIKSFLPLRYAKDIKIGQKSTLNYGGEKLELEVSQILHKLDETTQQVVVLSAIKKSKQHLFINAFVESIFYIGSAKKYLTIDKSALSFYQNDWVVFVPKEEEHKEGEDEHDDEFEYDIKVIKIVKTNRNLVAIEGLEKGDKYVSDKSYYIKSLFLKSAMGEHGH